MMLKILFLFQAIKLSAQLTLWVQVKDWQRVVQAFSDSIKKGNKCIFSIVRFGNVIGSSGSVIPIFKNQIKMAAPSQFLTLKYQDIL